ncbi:MAG: diacylglycerol kinase family lipid kinase [Bacteroidales bacterium]|nr:diacylglycerol kinase family lipid kinase [Bacteroidales bacterium]
MSNNSTKIKTLFIVNPFSGVGRHRNLTQMVSKFLDASVFDYQVVHTEAAGHASKLSEAARDNGYQLIVAVGGDGTVNEVAAPLVGSNVTLGLVPSGSGNGLARHLNIPLETEKAIAVLNHQKTRCIDTVKVNDRLFLSIAGVGFDAYVAWKFASKRRRGFFQYARIILLAYFKYRPGKYVLHLNGQQITRSALFISFANSDQFGYNTSIAPQARIDDGLMDISIMRKAPAWKVPFLLILFFMKKIDRTKYVEMLKTSEVRVEQKKKHINLDGETVKMGRELHLEVMPASLNVAVPKV